MKPRSRSGAARVLVIHRYYWPDTPPYASLLRAIVRRWTDVGHQVDVLTSQPSYTPEADIERRPRRERVDDATVRRIRLGSDRRSRLRKACNAVWFPVAVCLRVLVGHRYDVVMCSTAPPVLLGATVSFAARVRRSAFIYHCMDLHPEIGAITGEFRNRHVYRLLRRLDTHTCASAAAVVVLSRDMRASLIKRMVELDSRIVELNNFDIPTFDREKGTAEPLELPQLSPEQLRIVFTGNLGRFQGLEAITAALLADDARLDDLQMVFMGEGAAKAGLIELVRSAPPSARHRVVFVPHGPVEHARALMRTGHLGLVSLVPGVIEYAYPSKTAAYLSEGLALLVAVEPSSSLAQDVEAWGVGSALPASSDGVATHEALASLVSRREEILSVRERALEVWRENFEAGAVLARWDVVLDGALAGGRS